MSMNGTFSMVPLEANIHTFPTWSTMNSLPEPSGGLTALTGCASPSATSLRVMLFTGA